MLGLVYFYFVGRQLVDHLVFAAVDLGRLDEVPFGLEVGLDGPIVGDVLGLNLVLFIAFFQYFLHSWAVLHCRCSW